MLLEELAHRDVVAHKISQGVALLRVDPSGEAHTNPNHIVPVYSGCGHLLLDALAYFLEGIGIGFKYEGNLGSKAEKFAFEIANGEVEVLP